MKPHYIKLRQAASTNTYLNKVKAMMPNATVVYTDCQTAGRGQRGNSWESEPGKNITFSMLLRDLRLPVRRQFIISEAVSIAIVEVLSEFSDGFSVKWPNDIYWRDKKICGILIENTISTEAFLFSIIGVGLNVNQTIFVSDAPNPVSLANIIGAETDTEEILHRVCSRIAERCEMLFHDIDNAKCADLHARYLDSLFRRDGALYPFALPDGTQIVRRIVDVASDGRITLADDQGNSDQFYFKEIAFVI